MEQKKNFSLDQYFLEGLNSVSVNVKQQKLNSVTWFKLIGRRFYSNNIYSYILFNSFAIYIAYLSRSCKILKCAA